ncbi:MAG: quinone-dependent dihydroorotate dehydrogenase, partial [Nocardioides sp.]|nr:quinone-dependent dihydroorotate dehydrogenase [Nocardioides sp.]
MKPYRVLFDTVLRRVDPELAHHVGFRAIRAGRPALRRIEQARELLPPVCVMGLTFPHRVGLAAGFDKNALGVDALAALGFGHVEIGTVTGLPQPGNPKPRLFRLPDDAAIVNRMGFNNDGAEVVAGRLAARAVAVQRRYRPGLTRPVLGVNIGKSKVVPEDDRGAVLADYESSTRWLAPHAQYLVVNVSSPNTPGLRTLQAVERLQPLLEHVRRTADAVTTHRVPLLVKIAPDLSDEEVLAVADLATAIDLDGIIATNTTTGRDGLRSDAATVAAAGVGGLSGVPLAARSLQVLRLLRGRVGDDLALVGGGGITTGADAVERIEAGADLVQGYTAFVYQGPGWPHEVARAAATARRGDAGGRGPDPGPRP